MRKVVFAMLLKVLFVISLILNIFLIYVLIMQWEHGSKGDYSGPDNREFIRVTSPDSLFDVVLYGESEEGALGSYVYQAYIVKRGMKPEPRTQFLEGTHVDSCKIAWETSTMVRFSYSKARILSFNTPVFMRYGDGKYKLIDVNLCSQ
jgi:hypothetical protein